MDKNPPDRSAEGARFAQVFRHLGYIAGYARRRGARDPESIAAEVMAIAWRRLPDIPVEDARPWLIGTARNVMLAQNRREPKDHQDLDGIDVEAPEQPLSPELDLDADLALALRSLPEQDREALLLVAWQDLTPTQAARSLGISATAFRMRLLRARRRLSSQLTDRPLAASLTSSRPNWRHS